MNDPREIASYRVTDVLGRGGMGVVYAAVHANGEPAAVKTVRVPTESTLQSIRREILMLRELRHPGVVAIRDHGIGSDGVPWYAMDLLRGRTLRDDLRAWFPAPSGADDSTRDMRAPRSRTTPEDEPRRKRPSSPPYSLGHVARLFRRICEPLAYVHGRGVIHRDLSPNNVFLVGKADDERPVLFDFGLAAQLSGAREVFELGGFALGTTHYMAPEQARGELVDARADIYSLGCMLYEALTGRPPFLEDGPRSVLMQHLEDPPLPPSEHVPAAAAYDDLVLRMLEKRPRDRTGYVDDVAAALARLEGAGAASHVDVVGGGRGAAGRRGGVHQDERVLIRALGAGQLHRDARRGLVVGEAVGVDAVGGRCLGMVAGIRGDDLRVAQVRGGRGGLGELRGELAEVQVLAALIDQTEGGRVPERRGAPLPSSTS